MKLEKRIPGGLPRERGVSFPGAGSGGAASRNDRRPAASASRPRRPSRGAIPGLALLQVALSGCAGPPEPYLPAAVDPRVSASQPEAPGRTAAKAAPRPFRARGRVVCLAEEMKRLHGAEVQPVHEHLMGFRLEELPAGHSIRYYALLRTAQSEALFVDERFRKHLLILSGRVFPGTAILEASGWLWIRDGKVYEVYYWCDVCSIRGIDPGPCACCQRPVELRERPAPRTRPGGGS